MPKFVEIGDRIRLEIESGKWRPGQLLGTTAELAERFDTTRETIFGTITYLNNAGLVTTKRGVGVVVANPDDRRPVPKNTRGTELDCLLGLMMRMAEDLDAQHAVVMEGLAGLAENVAALLEGPNGRRSA